MNSTNDRWLIDGADFQRYLKSSAKLEKRRGTISPVHQVISWCARQLDYVPKACAVPLTTNDNEQYAACDEFRCRRCGLHLEDWRRITNDPDTGEEEYYEYELKFCPECGAAVVDGEKYERSER